MQVSLGQKKKNQKNQNKPTKKEIEAKEKELKKKYFPLNLAKYVLFIIPIVYIIYLYTLTMAKGEKFYQPVLDDTRTTVMFVIAMLAFFSGAICKYAIKDLKEGKNITSNKVALNIIAIAQIVTGNIITSGLIWGGLYRIRKDNGVKFGSKEFLAELKSGIVNIIGAIIILLLVILCIYFLSRLYTLNALLPQ